MAVQTVDLVIAIGTGVVSPTGLPALLVIPGATGPIGPQGIAGPRGLTGTIGPQGSPGTHGVTGATGKQGGAGARGIQGSPGPTGKMGGTGATGPAGPQGPVGPKGNTGPIGPTGITPTPGFVNYVSSLNFTTAALTGSYLFLDVCSAFGQDGIIWGVDQQYNSIWQSFDDGEHWTQNQNVPSSNSLYFTCIAAGPLLPPGSRTPVIAAAANSVVYAYSLNAGTAFTFQVAYDGSPLGIDAVLYHYGTGNIIAIGHTASGTWAGTISAYNMDSQLFTHRSLPAGYAGDSSTRGLSLVQSPSGRVVASWTGLSGIVYSDDGGVTWNASSGISYSGNYIVAYGNLPGSNIWMAINGDINGVYSHDGATWLTLPVNPPVHYTVERRGFAYINGVFVVGSNRPLDPLYLTANNGLSWNILWKSHNLAANERTLYAGPDLNPKRLYFFENPADLTMTYCSRTIRHGLSVATGGFAG